MHTLHKSIIIGLTVLGLGATTLSAQAEDSHSGAQAQPHQQHQQHQQRHGQWGERAAARQQQLHDKLQLTPSQNAAWATYVAAIKPAPRAQAGQHGDWKALPAPERMEKRLEMAKQHLAHMETRLAALKAFYGVLTAEQKKVFDAHAMGHGKRHMRGHRMG